MKLNAITFNKPKYFLRIIAPIMMHTMYQLSIIIVGIYWYKVLQIIFAFDPMAESQSNKYKP